jgi:hypothetical protein
MNRNNTKPRKLKLTKTKGKFPKRKEQGAEKMFPKQISLMPQELKATPIWQFKRRYIAQAAITSSLSILGILNSAIVAQTTVLGSSLVRAIRIKKIRIWVPVTTQGTPVSVRLTPSGADSSNNSFSDLPETIQDTSISIDRPAFVSYKPSVDHPSGFWHYATTTSIPLVDIACNIGAVMDVDFEAVLAFYGAVGTFTTVLVGATPGNLYARNVLTDFVPQGVNQI